MVRSYNRRTKQNTIKQESAELKKMAEGLLAEQLNEDTPEANKEDIVRLLVKLASHIDKLTGIAAPDIKGR